MATTLSEQAGGTTGVIGHERGELVVLLDEAGRAAGTMAKADVHHADTPFHLAFSCHAVDAAGRVLLTRRAASKATFPAVWTNACCGHPAPGETLRQAVTRRLTDELGVVPVRLALAVPDFAYRAEAGGLVEHELCPVVVAQVLGEPTPHPDEVDDFAWVSWDELHDRARRRPESLSPWSVRQVRRLARLTANPLAWLDDELPRRDGALGAPARPSPVEVGLDVAVPDRPAHGVEARTAWPGGALDPVRVAVDEVLDRFLAERERDAALTGPPAAALAAQVRALVGAGGKRLRPAFTYWGHRATGEAHDDRVLRVAAAMELLHTFALVHDDVMDRSDRRRGRPTAQVALAERHRRDGLAGDSAWYGVSAALLAGDLAFVWADQLLETAGLGEDAMGRARQVFSTLRTEVVGGQALDLHLSQAPEADEAAAQRVALLKSARYTVTRPLQLGAVLAPRAESPGAGAGAAGLDAAGPVADPAVLRTLAAYGDAVGLALQMRDDVLGLFGDPAVTGKSRLDDLREGKRTVLVLRALDLAGGRDRALLAGTLGNPDLDERDAAACRAVVARSGALASVEALIENRLAVGRHVIAGLYEPARQALDQLAGLAVRRDV